MARLRLNSVTNASQRPSAIYSETIIRRAGSSTE
jgi:hypothetical protein